MDAITIVNGSTSLLILILGLILGISFIVKYVKTKKKLMPYVAIMGICMASFYSGGSASFISILVTGTALPVLIAGIMSYVLVPIAIVTAMYLGFTIFQPKSKKIGLIIFGLTAVAFYIALIIDPTSMITGEEPAPGVITDTGLGSIILYITIFYILSIILILVTGFFKLSKKIKGDEKKKTQFLAYGFLLFAIAAVVEILAFGPFIVIPRIITAISYHMLYRGFS